jgi:DNA-binding CsgD family transcriptional regulator
VVRRNPAGGLGDLSIRNPKFQKLLLALHTATESRRFLKAAERLIHAVIPCDVVYTLLHYSMDRGRSTVAWGSDGSTFTNEYLRESLIGNPLGWVLATKPGVKTFPLCDCYPSTEAMERDPYFIRFIQGIGIYHATSMIFWRENLDGADLVMGPHRSAAWPKFSPEEVERMELIHPHIDAAYRRINTLQTQSCTLRGLEEFVALLPLPAILIDWQLAPLFQNSSAGEAVANWMGVDVNRLPSGRDISVPKELLAAIDGMRGEWTNALRENPGPALFRERVVIHPGEPEMRALITMTALRSPHFGRPSFVVRFETQRAAEGRLATLTRLSPREQALVNLVCEGQSNQEIAEALGRCVNTVKSDLHAVFKKLDIPSRARLIALLR